MPDLRTMQAARPKCPALVRDGTPTPPRCDEPMRWAPNVDAWVCPLHGRIENGKSAFATALDDA